MSDKKEEINNKVLTFDENAIAFLEEMKEKLGHDDITDVIATSFDLLKLVDHLNEINCQLLYMNENKEVFPISLYDTEMNESALNNLKNSKSS